LLFFLALSIYLAWGLILSNEMAAKFVPMLTGLIVTLLFFLHLFGMGRVTTAEEEIESKNLFHFSICFYVV